MLKGSGALLSHPNHKPEQLTFFVISLTRDANPRYRFESLILDRLDTGDTTTTCSI
jgi:hypothetical protein